MIPNILNSQLTYSIKYTNNNKPRIVSLRNSFQSKTKETNNIHSKKNPPKTQSFCQVKKESMCYNLPLNTHDEDHFHHPRINNFKISFRHTYQMDF